MVTQASDIFENWRHPPGAGRPRSGCRGRDRGRAAASQLLRVRLGGASEFPTPHRQQLRTVEAARPES